MLRVDIEKWGASKDREMCSLMKHLGDSHITYHQKVHGSCLIVISLGYSTRRNVNRLIEWICAHIVRWWTR